jgi:hypothetical protein
MRMKMGKGKGTGKRGQELFHCFGIPIVARAFGNLMGYCLLYGVGQKEKLAKEGQ